jgi:hypothetical protein
MYNLWKDFSLNEMQDGKAYTFKKGDWPMIIAIHNSIIPNKDSQILNSGYKTYITCINATNLQLFILSISCEHMRIT